MKKIFISFILLFQLVSGNIFAQEPSKKEIIKIDKKVFNRIINNQFSFITTGQAKSTLSNFISYEAKDSQISFNGVLPLSKDSLSVKNYLSINANGAIDDGIFAIFNNSKLNTNTALEVKLHNLHSNKWSITYSQREKKEHNDKVKNLEKKYTIKKDSISNIHQNNRGKIVKLKSKLDSLDNLRKRLLHENRIKDSLIVYQEDIYKNQRIIQLIRLSDETSKELSSEILRLKEVLNNLKKEINIIQENKVDSVQKRISGIEKEIKNLQAEKNELDDSQQKRNKELVKTNGILLQLCNKIDSLKIACQSCLTEESQKRRCDSLEVKVSYSLYIVDSLILKYTKELKKYPVDEDYNLISLRKQHQGLEDIKNSIQSDLESNFKIKEVKISWSSISYKIVNNNFYLFDDKQAFDNQFIEKNFVSHEIAYEYNKYRISDLNKSYYSNLRIGFFLADNKDEELYTKEITENKLYQNPKDSSINRTSTKKYNAYIGDYQQDIFGMKISYDYYYFLFKNNNGGFHIYPEACFRNKYKPLYNLGIGMFLSFKNNTDIKSIVNAEFYFKLLDITSNNSVSSILKGNEAGIRMSFPIKFIFK